MEGIHSVWAPTRNSTRLEQNYTIANLEANISLDIVCG